MSSNHHCEALVLHCIDFRFRKSLSKYLIECFPEGYDLIAVAGGVKRLLTDGTENNFLLDQLRISNRLHNPEKIVLLQHEDCGAYGGSKAFQDFEIERAFQKQELQKAEDFLKNHFSQKVEKYFAKLSGEIEA